MNTFTSAYLLRLSLALVNSVKLSKVISNLTIIIYLFLGFTQHSLAAETNTGKTTNEKQLNLDLAQAVLLALSNNYQLKINQLDPQTANKETLIAKGSFDPSFFTHYSQLNSHTDVMDGTSELLNTTHRSELGIRGALFWGTKYRVSLQADSIDTNTGVDSASIGPSIEIVQPLLRGFGRDSAYAQVRMAKQQQQIAQLDFQLDLQQLIQDVTDAYIEFHLATENLKIARLNWQLAKQTLADEQERFELGRIAASDLLRPDATHALRHDSVLRAQRNLKYREKFLKSLIFSRERDLFDIQLHSTGLPKVNLMQTNIKHDFVTSLKQRPEYKIAKLSLQTRKIQLAKDTRDKLPQLDLVVRYQNSGLSNQHSLSNAYDNYGSFGSNQNYMGINFSVPITNGIAKNKQAISKIKIKQGEYQIKQLERQIQSELDFAAFNLNNNWQQIEAAKVSVDLAQKTLKSEENKMSVGRSSSFFVLDLQSRLATAKIQQTTAVASYVKSIVEYQRQTGNLLSHYGVKAQDFL